jgi:DNA-binding XRE family transcriptional regulator
MNRIKDARAIADLTQAELAKLIGISQQQVAKLETGKQRLTSDMAMTIARALNMGLQDIVAAGQRPTVPFIGKVASGGLVVPYSPHERQPPDMEAPPMVLDGSVALEVVGDAMFPAYRAGDILILDPPEEPGGAVREECCVTLLDGRMILRRLLPCANGRVVLLGIVGPEASEADARECRRIRLIMRARAPLRQPA